MGTSVSPRLHQLGVREVGFTEVHTLLAREGQVRVHAGRALVHAGHGARPLPAPLAALESGAYTRSHFRST